MNIVVDNREPILYSKLTELYSKCAEKSNEKSIEGKTSGEVGIVVESKPLVLGDITLEIRETNQLLVIFERKSLADLVASIKDGRYAEQSHRLIHTRQLHTHNIVYIIEGMFSQLRNEKERQMCLSAMASLSYYKGFSVIRTCSIHETAQWIYSMSNKIQKERLKGTAPAFSDITTATLEVPEKDDAPKAYCEVVHKVKKDNITPENIGEIILCTIPGISSTTAIEIMGHYTSFSHFMEEIESQPNKLHEIYLTSNGKKRKLGKNIIENIMRFLRKKPSTISDCCPTMLPSPENSDV